MANMNVMLMISLALVVVSVVDMSPLLGKSQKLKGGNKLGHYQKRNYFNPLFDDVNRCILACGECSGDLETADDKVTHKQKISFYVNL